MLGVTMADGDLVALHSFTKQLSGPMQQVVHELDQRSHETVENLVQEFHALGEAVTSIADSYEAKVADVLKALEDATLDLTQHTDGFSHASGTFEQTLGTLHGSVDTGEGQIMGDVGGLGDQVQTLDHTGQQLQQLLGDALQSTLAGLAQHGDQIGTMIQNAQQSLDQFVAHGNDLAAQAGEGLANLDHTATQLLDAAVQTLDNSGDQGLQHLTGEAGTVLQSAHDMGEQVLSVAGQVLDQVGDLGDQFSSAVDQVSSVIDTLVSLVEALGPLVQLAEEL